jgi:hypothetical protein
MSGKTVLLKDADFLVRDYTTIEKKMSVVIEGNLIAGVGESSALKKEHTIDETMDMRGKVLYENRMFKTVDPEKVLSVIDEAGERINKKILKNFDL